MMTLSTTDTDPAAPGQRKPRNPMNLTVSKVTINEALSEETNCFSATVLIDGKPSFVAGNRGTGGENDYSPVITPKMRGNDAAIKAAYTLMHASMKLVADYAKTLPQVDLAAGMDREEPMMHQPDLDWVIDELVDKALEELRLRKAKAKFQKELTSKVLLIDGKIMRNFRPRVPGADLAPVEAFARKKYPNAVYLDRANPDAAWELAKPFFAGI